MEKPKVPTQKRTETGGSKQLSSSAAPSTETTPPGQAPDAPAQRELTVVGLNGDGLEREMQAHAAKANERWAAIPDAAPPKRRERAKRATGAQGTESQGGVDGRLGAAASNAEAIRQRLRVGTAQLRARAMAARTLYDLERAVRLLCEQQSSVRTLSDAQMNVLGGIASTLGDLGTEVLP